jgi:hypothetical protein
VLSVATLLAPYSFLIHKTATRISIMKLTTIRALLFVLAAGLIATPAHALNYTVTILQPPGYSISTAWGTGGTSQAGFAWDSRGREHAALWNGSAATFVDLNPSSFETSTAYGVSGSYQVGAGYSFAFPNLHALLWNGTPESAVDLHPAGMELSRALAVSGATQVGYAQLPITGPDQYVHALMWNGTAASVVDLHPAGFYDSEALGVSGTTQVGFGDPLPLLFDRAHALLWNSTPESAVDLNPAGFDRSYATAVSGTNQVGYGSNFDISDHALLWHGTAASVIDLNPSGFGNSRAYGASTTQQVGYGYVDPNGPTHAIVWSGTAASGIDLQPFVTALDATLVESYATSISENGSIAGWASDGAGGRYAVLWTPVSVPEPSSCALAVVALAVVAAIRARR